MEYSFALSKRIIHFFYLFLFMLQCFNQNFTGFVQNQWNRQPAHMSWLVKWFTKSWYITTYNPKDFIFLIRMCHEYSDSQRLNTEPFSVVFTVKRNGNESFWIAGCYWNFFNTPRDYDLDQGVTRLENTFTCK